MCVYIYTYTRPGWGCCPGNLPRKCILTAQRQCFYAFWDVGPGGLLADETCFQNNTLTLKPKSDMKP